MKNRKLETISVLLIIGFLLIAMYIYHSTNDEPNKVILKWLLKDPKYKDKTAIYMTFSFDPSYKECDAYCKLSDDQWLKFRIEKGFLNAWKVVHVEEVSFEELPEWIHKHINEEPEIFKEWEETHRNGVEKMITYDEYIGEGTLYYIKLKNNVWLILRLTKVSSENWSIEEKEIGKDTEEIVENLSTLYDQGKVTVTEIEKFLEVLAEDGANVNLIRDRLIEKGAPL